MEKNFVEKEKSLTETIITEESVKALRLRKLLVS